ncbi:MAG TPA: MBL fold metallo-hydrolase, partial [Spongiibacteraceae bacterium]|nr:MBL fold metallo-hydrolase [Spongiibacteraceae bacterium]
IKWLRMPMPFRLDHINIYLLRTARGWMIVDTGLNTDTTKALWQGILAALPVDEPITAVLCTHSHTDHAGALGWLIDTLRVPLYMSLGDYFSLRAAADNAYDSWQYAEFYQRLGLPSDHIETLIAAFGGMRLYAPPPMAYHRLREGAELSIGDISWRIIVGEGHAPEHVSLYSEQLKVLICGDQLLPRISANISVNAIEPDANPLELWFESLQRVGKLPADTLVLPSHDLPYYGLDTRALQLRRHHEQQLENLLRLCAEHPGSVYEIMQRMFPRRHGPLDDFLAVSECLAHLTYLLRQGSVARVLRADGSYRFGVPA